MRQFATSAYHPNGNGGVERVNHTIPQIPEMVVTERQVDWHAHLPHVESAYNFSSSTGTGLAPNEAHMNRAPRFPLTIFGHHYARGHQSFALDRLKYCDVAAGRQQRGYALARKQHALTASLAWSAVTQRSPEHSNDPLRTPSVAGYGFTTPLLPFAGCQI